VGKSAQLTRRLGAGIVKKMTPVMAAESKIRLHDKAIVVDSLGSRVLASQKGLMANPSHVLYDVAKMGGLKITPEDLPETQRALAALQKEMAQYSQFPEAKVSSGIIESIQEQLKLRVGPTMDERLAGSGIFPGSKVRSTSQEIDFQALLRSRQMVGAAVHNLEQKVKGVRLFTAKKAFGSMATDMEGLAGKPGLSREVATVAIAATSRAKLQFAVDDLKAIIARATTSVKGGGEDMAINSKQVLDGIKRLTDPASDRFDRNFTSAQQ